MRLWWPLQHLVLHCSTSLAGDGLSTRRTPTLPSSFAPRRLRCLLRAGLPEELHAELRDDVLAALVEGLLDRCRRDHPPEHRGLSTILCEGRPACLELSLLRKPVTNRLVSVAP